MLSVVMLNVVAPQNLLKSCVGSSRHHPTILKTQPWAKNGFCGRTCKHPFVYLSIGRVRRFFFQSSSQVASGIWPGFNVIKLFFSFVTNRYLYNANFLSSLVCLVRQKHKPSLNLTSQYQNSLKKIAYLTAASVTKVSFIALAKGIDLIKLSFNTVARVK